MSSFNLNALAGLGSLWVLGYAQPIIAQVIPDSTLPLGERSQVTGDATVQIDGGVRRGGNLFHSFQQFSIPTGSSASFNNANDVQNIFSRVTGGIGSNIDGEIRVNGTANLFLLNPNGILFDRNASLNLGGSFLATTASAIGFPNGEVFSSDATQPLPSQLLTINPNALLFNQLAAQSIVNRSISNNTGLRVLPEQNLLLVGGAVLLDNGRVASPSSYVEVGSVDGVGTVGLATTPVDWQLSIPDSVVRSDVALINNSRINVLGSGGGSIAITARNLSLSNISRLRVGFDADSGSEGAQAGDLRLNATGTIDLSDRATLRIEGLPGSIGNVGDMTITTRSFLLSGDSRLIAIASGQGSVGKVTINARDVVSLDNSIISSGVQTNAKGNTGGIMITTGSLTFTAGSELSSNVRGQGNASGITINAGDRVSINGSAIFNTVESTGVGNTSGVTIRTGSLVLTEGAQLISSTSGLGDAGRVTISAIDRVSLDGEISDGSLASTIFTRVEPGAIGQGGDVMITTGSLSLTNGGAINTANIGGIGNAGRVIIQTRDAIQIRGTAPINIANRSGIFTSATSGSVGNGGDIFINTGSLSVSNQGRIITNAEAQGNAGKIQIQAKDAVLFDGGDAITTLLSTGTGRGGDIDLTARSLSLRNGAQLTASTSGAGRAGNIQVKVGDLQIAKGAEASVSSSSREQAGSLSIEANRIFLDSGKIQADTSGGGGNIELRSPIILLRNGSNITTNATGPNIPGGGIAIESRFLVAVPQEDSNISANSEDFRGGSVGIKAVAIYGIQPQPGLTALSDITATGATSTLSGTVQLNLEQIDPASSLAKLPTTVADSSRLIAQGCPATQGNSFVISGRGGLPPTPEQQLDDDAAWQDLRQASQPIARSQVSNNAPIVEATGWKRTPTGKFILVANAPHSTFQNRSVPCNGSGVTP